MSKGQSRREWTGVVVTGKPGEVVLAPERGMVRVRVEDVRALVKGYGYGLLDDGFDVELMGRVRRVIREAEAVERKVVEG